MDLAGISLPASLEPEEVFTSAADGFSELEFSDREHESASSTWKEKHRWLPASKRKHNHIFGTSSEGFKLAASQASVTLEMLLDAMPAWTDDYFLIDIIKCLKFNDLKIPLYKLIAQDPWHVESCFKIIHSPSYSDLEARKMAMSQNTTGPPKIIQIGFNKAGTRSIWKFFHDIDVASAHWEGGLLAQAMDKNMLAGKRLFEGYEDFD